jgi:nitrate/nitrite-specific signal transduction histidine kinase
MSSECLEAPQIRDSRVGSAAHLFDKVIALFEPECQLEDMLTQMHEQFAGEVNAEFRVIVEGAAVRLRSTVQGEVRAACREALANAFRHSCADTVEVEVAYRSSGLRIVVRDNGVGIEASDLEPSATSNNGLSLMKDRIQNIGGRLRVLSYKGAGTELEIAIPGVIAFASEPKKWGGAWLNRFYVERSQRAARIPM